MESISSVRTLWQSLLTTTSTTYKYEYNKEHKINIRTRSDFEKHFTIKNCDKTFLKIISRLKKLLKSDDVSTLAERHYQVKIS